MQQFKNILFERDAQTRHEQALGHGAKSGLPVKTKGYVFLGDTFSPESKM